MTKNYCYKDQIYSSLYEVRQASGKVFPDTISEKDLSAIGITVKNVEPSPEELEEQALFEAKLERAETVESILVEVDGLVFNGDEKSQDRMSRTVTGAIASGLDLDTTKIEWTLANDVPTIVTVRQVAKALCLAGFEQSKIWGDPYKN